jgi:hypothetical protein
MNDSVDRFREGSTRFTSRVRDGLGGALLETDYQMVEYDGLGEDAYKARDIGVSLNSDYHPSGSDWSLNARVDVFSANVTNPASGLGLATSGFDGWWENIVGTDINYTLFTDASTVDDGTVFGTGNSAGSQPLDGVHSETFFATGNVFARGGSSTVVESVDDERTGIGFNGMLEFERPWAGGETRTHVGFGLRPYDIDATVVQRQIEGETFWWNAGAGDREATFTDIDRTVTTERSGDMTNTVLEAGTKWRRELSNTVSVGLGLIATRTKSNEDYMQTTNSFIVDNRFDDGDAGVNTLDNDEGGFGIFNEQETLIEQETVTDVKDETTVNTFRFPVGSTWKVTQKIKANLGVTNTVTKWTRETTSARAEGDDGRTVTTFNDFNDAANNTMTYATGGFDNFNETVTNRSEDHTTTYWYGLEFLVGSAAQINVNGFFDTNADRNESAQFDSSGQLVDVDFFRNLAISITFMFD